MAAPSIIGADPVTRRRATVFDVVEPEADLTDGFAADGIGDGEGVSRTRTQPVVLSLDEAQRVSSRCARRHRGDQRDQGIGASRDDKLGISLLKGPEHDGTAVQARQDIGYPSPPRGHAVRSGAIAAT